MKPKIKDVWDPRYLEQYVEVEPLTAEQWRARLDDFYTDGWYEYNGKQYFFDWFGPGRIEIYCYETQVGTTCHSVEEAMTAPIFDGHSLEEIAEQLLPI